MKSLAHKFNKRKLKHLYVAKRLTTDEIAKFYDCNDETIRNYLIKFGIKRRRDAPRYTRSVKKLTKTQISYLAGIIDGEGTITTTKSSGSIGGLTPLVSVANTDKKLIDWLKENIGGNVTASQPKNKNWKLKYRWYLYSVLDVSIIIKMIFPYLIIKKKNAHRVLTFCNWRLKLSKESRKKPIVYPRKSNGDFAKTKKIVYNLKDKKELEGFKKNDK